ncbi:MAG: hypothetical protein KGR26_14970, partial [Cyanobacteria bacterium REEB65]|nr:hypothetical protein [Cyanobacteria bacterium REEB65]
NDPLMLDLKGDGTIHVTGKSSAMLRNKKDMGFVAAGSVMFDIAGTGQPQRIEWVKDGDGILVDNRQGKARKLVSAGKPLSIANLFGDAHGRPGGFTKLREVFAGRWTKAHGQEMLQGKALDDMLVWIDANGDGKATLSELHTLPSLGITAILLPNGYFEKKGEIYDQATFVRKGKPFIIQEVWLARAPQHTASLPPGKTVR